MRTCDCEITKCNKDLNPTCEDIGICVNCPPPTIPLVLGGIAVVIVLAGVLLWRRRRSRA